MAHLDDLRPKTKKLCEMWIEECRRQGINLVVTQTFRSPQLQEAYYSQGREQLSQVNARRKKVGLSEIKEHENKIVTKDTDSFNLTFRQEQILQIIKTRGSSNQKIANMLKISASTVKMHVGLILKK